MTMLLRALLFIAVLTGGGAAMAADPENTLYMDLAFGRVVISCGPIWRRRPAPKSRHWPGAGFMTASSFTG